MAEVEEDDEDHAASAGGRGDEKEILALWVQCRHKTADIAHRLGIDPQEVC